MKVAQRIKTYPSKNAPDQKMLTPHIAPHIFILLPSSQTEPFIFKACSRKVLD